MGVPGFYSWLIKRYPLVKHMIEKEQVPEIDYLYLDMNGIIYKCVKDDEIIFKSQILPKEMEQIWLDVFNYINMLVNILKPNKMVVLGLDGVAPRAKMNNQRSRRFKSSRDHKKFMEQLYGFTGDTESMENFKNNSISPGTAFMDELGKNLEFFIKKKIEEDDYWKSLSVVFTSSSSPGEGEHKIMEFIRANKDNFLPDDSHCLYGADADLIMLSMTLPLKNLCIIREEYIHSGDEVRIIETKKEKVINFEMIFVGILKEYFEIEYTPLQTEMKVAFDIERIIKDFVFLFFFIGNDFLPRCMAYNIRQTSIEDLIDAFKEFLKTTEDYVVGPEKLNLKSLTLLANVVAIRESKFIDEKSEDLEKFVENKEEFEKSFNEMAQQKAMKENEFILQLKSYYKNNQIEARNLYYGQYFKINPAEQAEEFYKILTYYLHGLQFVYEYYFINLPSWQWFYPYYCAPLVSDIFFYLNYLSSLGYELPKIEQGQPAEPFKQLLCILPKESCELLPSPFRKYFLDKESILRSPLDYYPDNFEEEPYGSTRGHEFIALIPFLDLDTINKAYDEAITDVEAEDLERNKIKPSILFEFDPEAEEKPIVSKFPSIPTRSCTIRETPVNLKDRIQWKTMATVSNTQEFIKMPSLKIKQFIPKEKQDKRKKYFVIELQNQEDRKIKLETEIFFGYPLESSGKVEAFITREHFVYKNTFDAYNYYLDYISRDFLDSEFLSKRSKEAFNAIKENLEKKEKSCFDWKNVNTIVFSKETHEYVRCLNGEFKPVYQGSKNTKYSIVPLPLISEKRVYQNTKDKVKFNSLEEEFPIGDDVIVFPDNKINKNSNELYAQKGKVVGYTHDKIKVQTGDKIKQVDNKILEKIVHTRDIYFTLEICSFMLEIRQEVLLTLLESINIKLNVPELPPSIDIGLNYINRHEEKLVPNLVRINFDNEKAQHIDNNQKIFKYLDISLKGLELIIEYKKKFGNIFKFIEARYEKLIEKKDEKGKINWREPITLEDIYSESDLEKEKQVKSLMNVYLWLIKKEETHMPLSSIYSKQISKKNIQKLEEMFIESEKNKQKKKVKYTESKIIEVDPNYLFSRRLANLGKMYLSKAPKATTIRDQVICLQPEFFGEFGVVIGFDKNKFEVMFNQPSFGKTDLNGLCSELWAGKFFERDLFNFATWPEMFRPRPKGKINMAENVGFDGSNLNKEILPKFTEKALREFEDIKVLAKNYNFSKEFLDFVETAKKNQKVEKITEGYHVVDNKKKQYALKYDAEKSTIPKEYIEKVTKDKKFIEKPINPHLVSDIQVESYEKEVIQNKITEDEKEQQNTENVQNTEKTEKIVKNVQNNEKDKKIEVIENKKHENETKGEEEDDDEDDGDDILG